MEVCDAGVSCREDDWIYEPEPDAEDTGSEPEDESHLAPLCRVLTADDRHPVDREDTQPVHASARVLESQGGWLEVDWDSPRADS